MAKLLMTLIALMLPPALAAKSCHISGCSREVCSENIEAKISDCRVRPEGECYKKAKCRRQTDGKCGWTQTDKLTACLKAIPAGRVYENLE